MHKTPKIYTMIFCLGVLVFVMIMIFVRTLSYDVLVKKFHIDHPILHVIFLIIKDCALRSEKHQDVRIILELIGKTVIPFLTWRKMTIMYW